MAPAISVRPRHGRWGHRSEHEPRRSTQPLASALPHAGATPERNPELNHPVSHPQVYPSQTPPRDEEQEGDGRQDAGRREAGRAMGMAGMEGICWAGRLRVVLAGRFGWLPHQSPG